MNINPSIVIGHFRLKDRYCTESTYWYSNLLDYTRSRVQSNAIGGPGLGEEITLNADQTFTAGKSSPTAEKISQAAGANSSTAGITPPTTGVIGGSYSLLEQGPTRILAVTKVPGGVKGSSDSQAHHKIELTFKGPDFARTTAIDLVNSGFDQLVLVEEVPRVNCEAGDSLSLVYERIKP